MTERKAIRLIGGALGVFAVTIGALALGMSEAEPQAGPVSVEVVDASVDGGHLRAVVKVLNEDSLRHEFDVFLTVGVFGSDSAWNRRIAELRSQPLGLKSGDDGLVVWDDEIAVPTGDYELTAWVRSGDLVIQQPAPFAVSAEAVGPARVVLGPQTPDTLATADITQLGDDFLRLAGHGEVPEYSDGARLKVDVLAGRGDLPWWSEAAVASRVVDVEEGSGDTGVAPLDFVFAVEPGVYSVRLELFRDDVLVDQLLLPGKSEVDTPDASIVREALPVGPIVILSATSKTTSWSDSADAVVSIEVENTSFEAVDGLFWWILATPGEPEPWIFAEARSFEIGRRLEANERRTFRLSLDGDLEVGSGFELSVWSHVVDADGESTHSDGVRMSGAISSANP